MRESGPASARHIDFLTKQYAFYLRFQNGYGDVLLGSIYGLVYIVNLLFGPGALAAGLTAALSIVWILSKDSILQKCYCILGKPTDYTSKLFKYWRVTSITLITFLITFLTIYCLTRSILGTWTFQPTTLIILLTISVLPLFVWRYLRTPFEFVFGVILLLVGVLASAGMLGNFFSLQPYTFPVFGLFMIIWGTLEDLEFRWLAHRLEEA